MSWETNWNIEVNKNVDAVITLLLIVVGCYLILSNTTNWVASLVGIIAILVRFGIKKKGD